MATDLGRGTTVTFATSSFSADIVAVNGPSYSRQAVNTSHMGTTTAHTFVPSDLYDGGEIGLTIRHDGAQSPPVSGAAETITIAWGGAGTSYTSSCSAFMIGYTPSAEAADSDSVMEAEMTLKVTGAVTF